ncbi:TonB-dependent receptor [Tenuifilaceae bacterium CYCD]|nr:TonB-dependent receptor [Tenuifilaceae bacterium CYCD]
MKNVLFAILIITFPLALFSQKSSEPVFKLRGQVSDSTSNVSIPYATITILNDSDNSIEKQMATDADGVFETSLNSSGNYVIVANSIGYNSIRKPIEVKSFDKLLDVGKLALSQATVELGEVQVVGLKPLVKVEADKLTYNADADPDTKTSNALDLLKKVPLITVDGEDNVQLKGSSNYKVFMNGKPSTMATNNTKDFLKNLPASSIKNIEVITSPGAKYDAEGVGGIINIITQKKILNGYTGSVNAGVNNLGVVNGGISYSATFGKLGVSTSLYNYYQDNPYYRNSTFRIDTSNYTSTTDGKSKYKGMSPWGEGELSYEIDSLNLINASFGFWYAKNKNLSSSTRSEVDLTTKEYRLSNETKYVWGEPEGSIDYQRISKRNKDQIFTLSYKVNSNPEKSDGESVIDNVVNYYESWRKSKNDASSTEHTFQADYVKPFALDYKLEIGLKYILRKNSSETDAYYYDYANQQFVYDPTQINDFDYTQNIYAAYLSGSKSIKKLSLKAGLRVENVNTDGTFTASSYTDFENSNFEYVPSASMSYQMNEASSIRLSYSKRIQRPDIWYLNPFVNDLDPTNISYGNPKLDPERFHNFELNVGRFSKAGSINFTLYNSFSNNGIDRITSLKDGALVTTYGNVDKIQTWGVSSYASLRFGQKINVNINGSVNYNSIDSQEGLGLRSDGWGYNVYGNVQYLLPKGFKVSAYGMCFKRAAQLQTSVSTFYNMGLSVSKSMLKEKMTISLSARNIFWDKMKYTYTVEGVSYRQESEMYRSGRNFGIYISYRFGEMNTQLKKTQRGINNDDVKKGESGGSSGGN